MLDNIEKLGSLLSKVESLKQKVALYKVGFFSVLALLAIAEIDLSLSNQVGERIQFQLNPSHLGASQSSDCK